MQAGGFFRRRVSVLCCGWPRAARYRCTVLRCAVYDADVSLPPLHTHNYQPSHRRPLMTVCWQELCLTQQQCCASGLTPQLTRTTCCCTRAWRPVLAGTGRGRGKGWSSAPFLGARRATTTSVCLCCPACVLLPPHPTTCLLCPDLSCSIPPYTCTQKQQVCCCAQGC